MNISEQDDVLIDGYLQKTLSNVESQQILRRIENDRPFREEVVFRQLLQQASKIRGQQNLEILLTAADQELDEAAAERESETSLVRHLFAYRWAAAAAIALFVLASMWYLLRAPEHQALYAAHFEAFPNLVAPIDKSQGAENARTAAFQAYERGDFILAAESFEHLKKEGNLSGTDSLVFDLNDELYYGLSLLGAKQTTAAIAALKTVANDSGARYQEAAQWYLALAFLKIGALDNCKEQLDLILGQPKHRYRQKAERLASEL